MSSVRLSKRGIDSRSEGGAMDDGQRHTAHYQHDRQSGRRQSGDPETDAGPSHAHPPSGARRYPAPRIVSME